MISKRRVIVSGVFATLLASWVLASVAAAQTSLVNVLTQQLGVTENQAEGGAGSIFNMAKAKLSPQDFSQVANAVPDMNNLLQAAPKSSGLAGAIGEQASRVGGGTEQLGGLANLAGSFSKLGLSPDMTNKFVSTILSFVQANGGESVKNILATGLQ